MRIEGDEEMAYVLFMRFIEVFEKIMASKEYKTNKVRVTIETLDVAMEKG